jgi:hypothetical protein
VEVYMKVLLPETVVRIVTASGVDVVDDTSAVVVISALLGEVVAAAGGEEEEEEGGMEEKEEDVMVVVAAGGGALDELLDWMGLEVERGVVNDAVVAFGVVEANEDDGIDEDALDEMSEDDAMEVVLTSFCRPKIQLACAREMSTTSRQNSREICGRENIVMGIAVSQVAGMGG